MSADNGIYILETLGNEYRVAELMAIDNVNWDDSAEDYTDNNHVRIANARKMWKAAPVFTNEADALKEAHKLLEQAYICEYGICFITIPRNF